MRTLPLCILLVALTGIWSCAVAPPPGLPGLQVHEGAVIRAGKPFRGIGVNYFTLFYRTLKDSSDQSYRDGLARLASMGIPFVRFMASGFWPADWRLYQQDKEEYFRRLDDVVAAAEDAGIGLIPSLFWYTPTVPDLLGEPLSELGNPSSRSNAFIRQYTAEVVSRYLDSPAIWGWEFGNEYNLFVNLPSGRRYRPPVYPDRGTPDLRTARDDITFSDVRVAMTEFARTVRSIDQARLLTTGHSVPRPNAYHSRHHSTWESDSRDQFGTVLLEDTPAPFDSASIHVYPVDSNDYPAEARSVGDLIGAAKAYTAMGDRALFVGEFGVSRQPERARECRQFQELLEAIELHAIQLSAFWVFDYPEQEGEWNVAFDNDRAYMLELVAAANARFGGATVDADTCCERHLVGAACAG